MVVAAIKNRLREQIENIEEEIYTLDRSKNLKMDVIQEVLALIRNIGATYKKASPELKKLYLGLFWDKFMVAEKKVQEARKSPIVSSLEAIGALRFSPKPLKGRL